jgi:hypothetical protein
VTAPGHGLAGFGSVNMGNTSVHLGSDRQAFVHENRKPHTLDKAGSFRLGDLVSPYSRMGLFGDMRVLKRCLTSNAAREELLHLRQPRFSVSTH